MNRLQNLFLDQWVKSIAEVTTPDGIVVCDGSSEEIRALEAKMLADGAFIELRQLSRNTRNFRHRPHLSDVAFTRHLAFNYSVRKEDAGATNNWIGQGRASPRFSKELKGRTMYVVPYLMGLPGWLNASVGFDEMSSEYVVATLRLNTRMGKVGPLLFGRLTIVSMVAVAHHRTPWSEGIDPANQIRSPVRRHGTCAQRTRIRHELTRLARESASGEVAEDQPRSMDKGLAAFAAVSTIEPNRLLESLDLGGLFAQLSGWPLLVALTVVVAAILILFIFIMVRRYILRIAWGNGRIELAPSDRRGDHTG